MAKKALIVVDVQNDFCPGGTLAVPYGDEVVEPLNIIMAEVAQEGGLIVVSRDWHPANSDHFKKWPVHCVQYTKGAELHPLLKIPSEAIRIYKGLEARGSEKEVDGYSVFDGMTTDCRKLEEILRFERVEHVIVGGLATDYCVRATVRDALRLGYSVDFLVYASRGVSKETTEVAFKEMFEMGVVFSFAPYNFAPGFGKSLRKE